MGVGGWGLLYGTSITNISGSINILVSMLCCTCQKVVRSPASQPISSFPMCGDRIFPLLAFPPSIPILSPCPIGLRTPCFPCLRLPFQVHRYLGSNLSSIAHCKTTTIRRESTSLSTTSPVNSNAAVPQMRSSWCSETKRGSLKNIETEIAS